jgi:undecaprenyl-diphosphatase
MSLLQIAILALIQGAAELLPVSSSAHVILAEQWMGLNPSAPEMTFLLVMLHTGTMFAVLYYFWPRWRLRLFGRTANGRAGPDWPFMRMIVLASALTGFLGLGLKYLIEKVVLIGLLHHEKGEVEHLFKNLPLIAAALFAVGIMILVAGSRETKAEAATLSPRASAWIGTIQGLCLPFRGFSRSGATISTGLFCGVSRMLAEEFSFALAVVLTPPVIGLELHRLLHAKGHSVGDLLQTGTWQDLSGLVDLVVPGLMGMAFSFLAGLVALRFLSAALEKGRWKYFGYYCLAAAVVVLATALATTREKEKAPPPQASISPGLLEADAGRVPRYGLGIGKYPRVSPWSSSGRSHI